jgi:hypothetical protein
MADYGSSLWSGLGNMQRPNAQMAQAGYAMMQPRPLGQPVPMPSFNLAQQNDQQPSDEAPGPGGKRRIRIGGKTYIEEDSTPALSTQIGSRSY